MLHGEIPFSCIRGLVAEVFVALGSFLEPLDTQFEYHFDLQRASGC